MGRALIRYAVVVNDPVSGEQIPVAGASGSIYRAGTLTPPVKRVRVLN